MASKARLLVGVLLSLCLLAAQLPVARAQTRASKFDATLHAKVLSYDRNLKEVTKGKLVIGILYKKGYDDDAKAFLDGLKGLPRGLKVQGMSISAQAIEVSSAKDIPSKVTVFFFASSLPDFKAILAEAKKRKAPTLTNKRSLVKKGVAVGVVPNRGSSKLVVNIKAAKEVKMRIDGKLLRIAELF